MLRAAIAFTRMTTGLAVTDTHNGLRVLTRSAAEKIAMTQSGMAHASELLNEIARHDLDYEEVPVSIDYTEYSKLKGQTNLNAVNIMHELISGRMGRPMIIKIFLLVGLVVLGLVAYRSQSNSRAAALRRISGGMLLVGAAVPCYGQTPSLGLRPQWALDEALTWSSMCSPSFHSSSGSACTGASTNSSTGSRSSRGGSHCTTPTGHPRRTAPQRTTKTRNQLGCCARAR